MKITGSVITYDPSRRRGTLITDGNAPSKTVRFDAGDLPADLARELASISRPLEDENEHRFSSSALLKIAEQAKLFLQGRRFLLDVSAGEDGRFRIMAGSMTSFSATIRAAVPPGQNAGPQPSATPRRPEKGRNRKERSFSRTPQILVYVPVPPPGPGRGATIDDEARLVRMAGESLGLQPKSPIGPAAKDARKFPAKRARGSKPPGEKIR